MLDANSRLSLVHERQELERVEILSVDHRVVGSVLAELDLCLRE